MSKPPEPSPRSTAWALTTTSSPTCAGPTSSTSAIAARLAVDLDHERCSRRGPAGLDDDAASQDEPQRASSASSA